MENVININMGELAIGSNDTRIKTSSIGSCVVVVLYDYEAKVGGMAHAMLPSRESLEGHRGAGKENLIVEMEPRAKYVDEAIRCMVSGLERMGGSRMRMKAKLVGGAMMFKILNGKKGIGSQNADMARKILEEMGIPIDNEETGGTVGRIAEVNLENGLVEVTTKM